MCKMQCHRHDFHTYAIIGITMSHRKSKLVYVQTFGVIHIALLIFRITTCIFLHTWKMKIGSNLHTCERWKLGLIWNSVQHSQLKMTSLNNMNLIKSIKYKNNDNFWEVGLRFHHPSSANRSALKRQTLPGSDKMLVLQTSLPQVSAGPACLLY